MNTPEPRRFNPFRRDGGDARRRRMWLYILLLAATIAVMAALRLCSTGNDAGTAAGRQTADTLRVAIIHSPMSYYIYDDTIGGLNYDLLRRMSSDINRPLKFIPVVSLEASLQSLANGGCDMLASLPLTSEMRDKYLFTESVFLDRQVLVQMKGKGDDVKAKSVLDLAGDTIHIEKNSPARERLENMASEIGAELTITSHSNLSDEYLFLKVAGGDFRYAVINGKTARQMAKKYPRVSVDTPIGFTQFQSWLTRRSDTALHDMLDNWLVNFKKTDEYKKLLKRYAPDDSI